MTGFTSLGKKCGDRFLPIPLFYCNMVPFTAVQWPAGRTLLVFATNLMRKFLLPLTASTGWKTCSLLNGTYR